MTAYEAFKLYLALKRHFTSSYDFHKYGGKLKVTEATFEKRNDKAFFFKLAKHPDLQGLLVSTFVQKGDLWVGDIIHNQEVAQLHQEWKKVQESFVYSFKNDLAALPGIEKSIEVVAGQHPLLLQRVLSHQTRIETMMALNGAIRFVPSWNEKIIDPIVWPDVRFKCRKYLPFITIDKVQIEKVIVDNMRR